MNSTISPSKVDNKTDIIAGLLELLARYGVRVYLQDGRLLVKKPWPSWDDVPEQVRQTLRWLKARKDELKRYLEERQAAEVMDNLFEREQEPEPEPERKRSTWLDRWPPLADLVARLEAAGFRLELDGELLRITPPLGPEELSPEMLHLYNQAMARQKALALHLRGREHQEAIRSNCRAYLLPPGDDPMDYRFNPETGEWEHRPGWWKQIAREELH